MTTAEKLRAEGRLEGRLEGSARTLLHQLTLKFGSPDAAVIARLSTADLDQLTLWSGRILTAESVEAVFDA